MFAYKNQQLQVEGLPLLELARKYGTPLFVYSYAQLHRAFHAYQTPAQAAGALIAYSVKANGNRALLQLLAQWGAGFDIVSGGELQRVLLAGGAANKVIFSGVGKSDWEMRAALHAGIKCFNVESTDELDQLNSIAQELNMRAPISLRINPNIDAKTHPYISTGLAENKFGIAHTAALSAYQYAQQLPHLDIVGIDCHIGSQILELQPLLDATDRVLDLCAELQGLGIHLAHIDIGGGVGIPYRAQENSPAVTDFVTQVTQRIKARQAQAQVIFEPGRSIVGASAVLLSQTRVRKLGQHKNFLIIDAAMNDLMRPSLYQAYHHISAVQQRDDEPEHIYEVVGPICETGDTLGNARALAVKLGDVLALHDVGAYGMSMSSNYNTRPRAAEILVKGDRVTVIRERETIQTLLENERALPLENW